MQNPTSWVWLVSQLQISVPCPPGWDCVPGCAQRPKGDSPLTRSSYMRPSFPSLRGRSFWFFCKHIAKGKRIKWPYTSSTQGPWFQSLVLLLLLPHSAPLQHFLLLKSRVWKNYRRQFTSFIPSERTPQTSTLNYYQKGSFGNSHFLKL